MSGEATYPRRASSRSGEVGRWLVVACLVGLGGTFLLFPALSPGLAAVVGIWGVLLLYGFSRCILFNAFGVLLCLQQLLVIHVAEVASPLKAVSQVADDGAIAVLFALAVVGALLKSEIRGSWHLPAFLLLLLLIGSASSAANSVPIAVSAFDFFLMVKVFLLFWIAVQLGFDEAGARGWWKTFTVFGVFMLILGMVDILTFPWFRTLVGNTEYEDTRWGFVSAQALFTHPGAFGFFMSVMALVHLGLYSVERRKAYLVLAAFFAFGVILSGRLKPIVGLPAAAIIVAVLSRQVSLRQVLAGALPVIAFILVFGVELLSLGRTKLGLSDRPTDLAEAAPRAALYLTSVQIARDEFPLGAGLGRFGGEISRRFYSPVYDRYGLSNVRGFRGIEGAENVSYYQDAGWSYYLGELGVLGVPVVAGLLCYLLREMLRVSKQARSRFVGGLALGAAMVLVEAGLEAVASPVLQSSVQGYFALAVAGVAYSAWLSEAQNVTAPARSGLAL